MAVPVPSISCCVLNHHNLFYQIQSALAFNRDTCCHLALCLLLLPFHSSEFVSYLFVCDLLHTHTHIYMYISIFIHTDIYIHIYTHIHTQKYTYTHTYILIYLSVCNLTFYTLMTTKTILECPHQGTLNSSDIYGQTQF
jgi:hypothetical protein